MTSSFKLLKDVEVPGDVTVLRSRIEIADATVPEAEYRTVNAIWDTGAYSCAVSKKTAETMNLIPKGKSSVCGIDSIEPSNVNAYLIRVEIDGYGFDSHFKATEMNYDGVDFLIGLQLIRMGKLCFDPCGGDGSFRFRFSIPVIPVIPVINSQKENPD